MHMNTTRNDKYDEQDDVRTRVNGGEVAKKCHVKYLPRSRELPQVLVNVDRTLSPSIHTYYANRYCRIWRGVVHFEKPH